VSQASRVGQASVTTTGRGHVRWLTTGPSLLAVWIVAMLDKSNISIVIANHGFLQNLGLSGKSFELGMLATGMLLAYGITAPLWGFAVSRFGPRASCIACLVIWAVASGLAGLSVSYGELLAFRIILGVGEAALYPVTLSLVANWFPLRERAKATAFWWNGTMIGPMIGGAVVTSLIAAFGWRGQFYSLAALAIILPLPMIVFLVRDRPAQHPSVRPEEAALIAAGAVEQEEGSPGRLLRTGTANVLRNFRFWLVTIAISANAVFFWGWSTWLPTYLKTVRHFSFSTAGYLTVLIYGAAVITIVALSYLSDKIFRRAPLAVAGWVLGGVFLIVAGLVPSATLSIVFLILSLCGQQAGISGAETLMHSIVASRDMAHSQGVRTFVSQIIGALSPAALGIIVGASNNFTAAFAVLAAAVLVSAGCMAVLIREGF
jgi:sugar phosphate permease